MSIIKHIPESVILDDVQQNIAEYLEETAQRLEEQYNSGNFLGISSSSSLNIFSKICKNFLGKFGLNPYIEKKQSSYGLDDSSIGIYLYGSVGRGKTMLIKAFFDRVNIPKKMVHFQNFMQVMHEKMHHLQTKSKENLIEDLAKTIADKCSLLAIDEFEVKDIADAMLIMRLFDEFAKLGVFICITTNIMPNDLYKDGLQRSLFLPFVKLINERFSVVYLDSFTDYRFKKNISTENRIFYPINDKNKSLLKNIKSSLTDYSFKNNTDREALNYKVVKSKSITVFGREVTFKNTYKNCLFTDFSELICRDFGYADYVNICQKFNVIVLENVEKIGENETDKITRLINFIDNAYFYKVLLFISLESIPEEIYTKGFRVSEFKRTISRLVEMNSQEYFYNS